MPDRNVNYTHFQFLPDGTYQKIEIYKAEVLEFEKEKFTDEQIEILKELTLFKMQESVKTLFVWYNSNCETKKCKKEKLQYSFLLDRFPMSPKIHNPCSNCKKLDLLQISDPITFYDSVFNKDMSLEELANCCITIPMQFPSNFEEVLFRYWSLGRRKYKLKMPGVDYPMDYSTTPTQ